MSKTARFWVWWSGWVRLSLRDGQSITAHRGGQHEEGWSSETATYTREGDRITCDWSTDGRDCDGRISHHGESWTTVQELTARKVDAGDPLVPEWHSGDSGQRDYSAEAMNY